MSRLTPLHLHQAGFPSAEAQGAPFAAVRKRRDRGPKREGQGRERSERPQRYGAMLCAVPARAYSLRAQRPAPTSRSGARSDSGPGIRLNGSCTRPDLVWTAPPRSGIVVERSPLRLSSTASARSCGDLSSPRKTDRVRRRRRIRPWASDRMCSQYTARVRGTPATQAHLELGYGLDRAILLTRRISPGSAMGRSCRQRPKPDRARRGPRSGVRDAR